MLHSIGRRQHEPDLVDLLTECHHRIRRFLELAHRLATTAGLGAEDIQTSAAQVHRYYTTAFPLHMADEEDLLLPRLRGREPALDAALARMETDHEGHADLVERLVALCEELMRDPQVLGARARLLGETVDALTLEMEAHLSLEELVIFPRLSALSAVERAAIRRQMRERRGG
jgi:iron-sulfur cluster repair protein YtfE (RIC family)